MAIRPETLRPHYGAFLRPGRVLLTGHSHQAWPDVARLGLERAFDDAALHCDDKWARAFEVAGQLRGAISERIAAPAAQIALGQNSHELVTRFLSALDLRHRPRLVTTTGEFHSVDRQLRRLAEAGVELKLVAKSPVATLAERLAAELDERTAAVLASTVLFETSEVVPGLRSLAEAAERLGVEVLLDAYHAFNVVPFALADYGERVFLTAGGYKYAQWGEGCCFMRVPPDAGFRPVFTGWFADFSHLEQPRGAEVLYDPTPAQRFAGSTYDPASHYRAVRVAEFFREQSLSVAALRELSLAQTGVIIDALSDQQLLTPRSEHERGGFVALRVAGAQQAVHELRQRGIFVDARGDILRIGPAPYVTQQDLDQALAEIRKLTADG